MCAECGEGVSGLSRYLTHTHTPSAATASHQVL